MVTGNFFPHFIFVRTGIKMAIYFRQYLRPIRLLIIVRAVTIQFLAKQLTLYQPGGQIMPTTVLLLFRPCAGPDSTMPNSHCVIFKIVQITCHSLFQIILHTSFQKLHVKLSKTQSNKHPVSIRSRYKVIHPMHYKH